MKPRTVPSTGDVQIVVTSPLTHRCPHVDEIDRGTVEISWRVYWATFELHSLRAYLDGFADVEISHEDLTNCIRTDLSDTLGIEDLTVSTNWDTAGMEVRCSTWQTPAVNS